MSMHKQSYILTNQYHSVGNPSALLEFVSYYLLYISSAIEYFLLSLTYSSFIHLAVVTHSFKQMYIYTYIHAFIHACIHTHTIRYKPYIHVYLTYILTTTCQDRVIVVILSMETQRQKFQ